MSSKLQLNQAQFAFLTFALNAALNHFQKILLAFKSTIKKCPCGCNCNLDENNEAHSSSSFSYVSEQSSDKADSNLSIEKS